MQKILVVTSVALIAIACVLLYRPVLSFDFHNVDDFENVEGNGDIRSINLSNIQSWFTKDYVLMYIPLTIGSFAFDYHFWHLNPFGYHLTNLVLHALNSILVFFLLFLLTRNLAVSLMSALVFAIHPVQMESVVWVSERKNVLSTLFFLTTILSYRKGFFWLTLLSFVAAILAKPNTVIIPAFLLMTDHFFGNSVQGKRRLILMLVMGLLGLILFSYMYKINCATELNLRGNNVFTNFIVMTTVFFRYMGLILFPFKQQLFYLTVLPKSIFELRILASLFGFALFFVIAFVLAKRKSQIAFWMLWFFVALLPTSNFIIPLQSLMHDRYLYLPIIGFASAVFLVMAYVMTRYLRTWLSRALIGIVFLTLLGSHAAIAVQRLETWSRGPDLWLVDMMKSKYLDPRMQIGYAAHLARANKMQDSEAQLKETISTFHEPEAVMRQAFNLIKLERFDEAKELLDTLDLKTTPVSTYWAGFYYDAYGEYWRSHNDLKKAEDFYKKSIEVYKKISNYIHLADLYATQGKFADSIRIAHEALQLDPDAQFTLAKLCGYYLDSNDYPQAFEIYQKLSRLYPKDALVQHIQKQMRLQNQRN